jgi:hypothetical protein
MVGNVLNLNGDLRMNPNFIVVCCYNLALLAGTVLLVGWNGWSPWWFLLTALLLASYKTRKNDD